MVLSSEKHYAYAFTWYNYKDELKMFMDPLLFAICVGYEKCPTNGRPHLQGYFVLDNPLTELQLYRKMKKYKMHIEVARKSPCINFAYCSKQKTNVFKRGPSCAELDILLSDSKSYTNKPTMGLLLYERKNLFFSSPEEERIASFPHDPFS